MIKNIIFDFDGVILNSIPVKTEAFRTLFNCFETYKVNLLIDYHLKNGGKSRYLKIQYFYEEILQQSISKDKVLEYAEKYSQLTKEKLANSKYLINDTLRFIKKNYKKYNIHIASGADENDLIFICKSLELNQYFKSIHGSPTIKSDIVSTILELNKYNVNDTILVGDSINDFEAAKSNNITFVGYNNIKIKKYDKYIESFSEKFNEIC